MSYQFGQIDPEERLDPAEDERTEEPAPPRRSVPAAAVALLVMAGFAGALWFAYYEGGRHATGPGGGVPLIRAEEGAAKVKPTTPGGMVIPDQDKSLYTEKPGGPSVVQVLPPAEQPMPRPVAPPPGTEPAGTAAPPPVAAAPAMPAPHAPAAAPVIPAAPSVRAPVALTPPKPGTATLPGQRVAPRGETARAPAGAVRIQIGAMRSEDLARREWARMKRADADLLGHLSAVAVRADLGAKGVFWRIQAGPVPDMAAAERICRTLKERKLGCMIVR